MSKKDIYDNFNNYNNNTPSSSYLYANDILKSSKYNINNKRNIHNDNTPESSPLSKKIKIESKYSDVKEKQPELTPPGRYYISKINYEITYEAFRRELVLFLQIICNIKNDIYREYLKNYYSNTDTLTVSRQSIITLFARILNINEIVTITDENFNMVFLKNYLKLNDLENVDVRNMQWFHIYWRILHFTSILTYYQFHKSNKKNDDIIQQFAAMLLTFNIFIVCQICFIHYMEKNIPSYVEKILSTKDPITAIYNLHNTVNFNRTVFKTETYYMSIDQFESMYLVKRID